MLRDGPPGDTVALISPRMIQCDEKRQGDMDTYYELFKKCGDAGTLIREMGMNSTESHETWL